MRKYETPVDVPAQQMFDYVSDPEHLREFVSAVSSGQPSDTAADGESRSVRWDTSTTAGPGELVIHEEDGDRCRVEVRLHSDDSAGEEERTRVEQALAMLAHGAAAHTDALRADHQDGWSG